jgi:hypothetical protein
LSTTVIDHGLEIRTTIDRHQLTVSPEGDR